eukprot:1259459-Prymnesium_polylepis.1
MSTDGCADGCADAPQMRQKKQEVLPSTSPSEPLVLPALKTPAAPLVEVHVRKNRDCFPMASRVTFVVSWKPPEIHAGSLGNAINLLYYELKLKREGQDWQHIATTKHLRTLKLIDPDATVFYFRVRAMVSFLGLTDFSNESLPAEITAPDPPTEPDVPIPEIRPGEL